MGQENFDTFYVSARGRLLAECYALTGDLAASKAAVQDAFATAWHHWRTVKRAEDAEGWVRSVAYLRAQRRRSARPFHKERDADDETRATLDALSKLSSQQRKALVLTTYAPLSMSEIGREVGVPVAKAEQLLQSATAKFALERDVESSQVRACLDALSRHASTETLPRGSIVRRSGTARRRSHSVAGVAAVLAAFLGSGAMVATGTAEASSLADEPNTTGVSLNKPSGEPTDDGAIADTALMTGEQVAAFDPKLTWTEGETSDNLSGDGLVVPCQQQRFADPEGLDARTRSYAGAQKRKVTTTVGRGKNKRTVKRIKSVHVADAVQMLERSADDAAAATAYASALAWYAGCQDSRTQLLTTQRVTEVGDDAALFTLRTWGKTPRRVSIGVARTGALVVTTAAATTGASPSVKQAAARLAAAVNTACDAPGAGECSAPPRARSVTPWPAGRPDGMLQSFDLPPVQGAIGPWVGTEAEVAKRNYAATRCDNTQFRAPGLRRPLTRTFVFLKKSVDAFGLTQSVAAAKSETRARAFVEEVRSRVRKCGEANLGTQVESLASRSDKWGEVHVWDLDIELSDNHVQQFWMAVVRRGKAVSQLGFTTEPGMSMNRDDFLALVRRAEERLADLKGA